MSNSASTLSSGGASIPPSFVDKKKEGISGFLTSKSEHKIPSRESEWGKFLALSTIETANFEKEDRVPYQQCYKELQAFLKKCDEPNGKYHQTIRNLSVAGRNGHAVQLEMRAIFLSLEGCCCYVSMKESRACVKGAIYHNYPACCENSRIGQLQKKY